MHLNGSWRLEHVSWQDHHGSIPPHCPDLWRKVDPKSFQLAHQVFGRIFAVRLRQYDIHFKGVRVSFVFQGNPLFVRDVFEIN